MNLEEAYYELRFENAYIATKGSTFQTFFEKLMGLAYPADFVPCRPWGAAGDKKNDGFLKSQRRLFQIYAPNEMEATKAKTKIEQDFNGAKVHWGTHFDKWTFVHNAHDGLPPHVHSQLLDFQKQNPGLLLEPWGLNELRLVFRRLSLPDRQGWFGPVPTEETKPKLGFKQLQVVLETIAGRPVPPNRTVKNVPAGKIEANALSECVSTLLLQGMIKAPLVEEFLDQWHDPSLGGRLAEAFRAKYQELRNGNSPNQTFSELQAWAGGNVRGSAEHELAVLTVIAYYFERCDIFEEPRVMAI